MIVTKHDIERKFCEYNEAYFGGKLPMPNFSMYTTKCSYGNITYYPNKNVKNKLKIAKNINWTEDTLMGTIIHEMIHLYLFVNYYPYYTKKYGAHGKLFKKVKNSIEKQYNIKLKSPSRTDILGYKNHKQPRTILDKIEKWFYNYVVRYILYY